MLWSYLYSKIKRGFLFVDYLADNSSGEFLRSREIIGSWNTIDCACVFDGLNWAGIRLFPVRLWLELWLRRYLIQLSNLNDLKRLLDHIRAITDTEITNSQWESTLLLVTTRLNNLYLNNIKSLYCWFWLIAYLGWHLRTMNGFPTSFGC